MSNCEFDEYVRHVDDVDLNDIDVEANDAGSAEAREETLRLQQQAREIRSED